MKRILNFAGILLLAIGGATSALAATPTATNFNATASTAGATLLQLQGADTDGTALTFAVASGPAHGALSGLDAATGYVVYKPNAGYIGADSFTFTVTSGGETTAPATVSLTVTNAKTRIVDHILDASGAGRPGLVTFILTQKVMGPAGLIPVTASVTGVVASDGGFDVSLYPSSALSPQAYYQMWYRANGSLRQELLGVYAIPASTPASVTLAPYRVTDTNLAAQYSFMPAAALNALASGLNAGVNSFNARTGVVSPATNDYTWAQINKTTSSLADLTTRSASDLSSGTLPPARLGSMTSAYLPYHSGSALADSPLSRLSANGIKFTSGGEAAPSNGSSTTGARIVFYDAAGGDHFATGVESGALWNNVSSTGAYKNYFGASAAEKFTVTHTGFTFDTANSLYTLNFHSSSGIGFAALIASDDIIRFGPSFNAGSYRWEMGTDGLIPIGSDGFLNLGSASHRVGDLYAANARVSTAVLAGSTSGATTVQAAAAAGTTTLTLPAATDTLIGKATTDTLTNKTIDAEGTGNTLTVPVKVFLPAAGCNNATTGSFWDLPTSAAAVPACVTGTNIQKGVLDFADSGPLSAQNTLLLPADFTGAIDARILWTTTATSGNAKWSLATACTDTSAGATDDPSFNTASTVTTVAPGTANRVQSSSITGLTATGCSAGNLLHLKISRDGTDGSDTIGATTRLIGVEITIRRAM
jgi:hypothetical protein